jgi:transposase InsO family protein
VREKQNAHQLAGVSGTVGGTAREHQGARRCSRAISTRTATIRSAERLAEAGIEPSVGSVGDSYDNALVETIFGLFKTEVIRRNGPWRNIEEVEFATLEWVDWFNNRRLLEPIGNIPPVELEQMYYEQQEAPAIGVGLN